MIKNEVTFFSETIVIREENNNICRRHFDQSRRR